LAKDEYNQIDTLRLHSGIYSSDEEKILQELFQIRFPGCGGETEGPNSVIVPRNNSWEWAEKVVTPKGVKWAISTFSPYKTAGVDGIFPAPD
jgi:hypothetical protein